MRRIGVLLNFAAHGRTGARCTFVQALPQLGWTETAVATGVSRTVPIVSVNVADPAGAGFVAGPVRCEGNATGFTSVEYGTNGKWLEPLKDIAPCVARAVIRDSTLAAGIEQLAAIQLVAPSLGVEVSPIGVGVRDIGGIEHAISACSGQMQWPCRSSSLN